MRVEEIKNLLRNTDKSLSNIAKETGVSPRTVGNINQGKTHFEEDTDYPLRVTGQRINQLKNKLSKPTKKAVMNPHILSPQLLDYIGFLSILGVGLECLLEFKEVYYKQLSDIFNREMSDEDIISIIKLRPSRPTQLKELVEAYYEPKVKLINMKFWLETGFIKKQEKEIIYSLLIKR